MGKKFVARIVVDQKYAGDFMALVDDMGEDKIEEFQIVALRKTRQATAPEPKAKALPAPKKKGKRAKPKNKPPLRGSTLDDYIIATIRDKGSINGVEAAEWAKAHGRSPDAASPRLHQLKVRGWIEPIPGERGRYQFKNGQPPADHVPMTQQRKAA